MWTGEVLVVQIAEEAGGPMIPMDEVLAVAGKGLKGDRYFKEKGFFSQNKGVRRQMTLFELEVLETLERDHRVNLRPEECRMNLVTRGVPLPHLVGQVFQAGEAVLRGVKLNEPCDRLESVVGRPIIPHLIHRAGLFAEILEGGIIRPGDCVGELDGYGRTTDAVPAG